MTLEQNTRPVYSKQLTYFHNCQLEQASFLSAAKVTYQNGKAGLFCTLPCQNIVSLIVIKCFWIPFSCERKYYSKTQTFFFFLFFSSPEAKSPVWCGTSEIDFYFSIQIYKIARPENEAIGFMRAAPLWSSDWKKANRITAHVPGGSHWCALPPSDISWIWLKDSGCTLPLHVLPRMTSFQRWHHWRFPHSCWPRVSWGKEKFRNRDTLLLWVFVPILVAPDECGV